jgi:hypothetical protein
LKLILTVDELKAAVQLWVDELTKDGHRVRNVTQGFDDDSKVEYRVELEPCQKAKEKDEGDRFSELH